MSGPGYGCAFCGGARPVTWLITSLADGKTLALCLEDFPVALIPLIAGQLGVDPDRLYDVVKRFIDREAAREAKAATKEAAAPPRRTVRPSEAAAAAAALYARQAGLHGIDDGDGYDDDPEVTA